MSRTKISLFRIPLRPVPLPHQEHRRPINYWRSSLIPEQLEGIYKQLPGSRFPSVQKLVAHIPDPYAAPLVRSTSGLYDFPIPDSPLATFHLSLPHGVGGSISQLA